MPDSSLFLSHQQLAWMGLNHKLAGILLLVLLKLTDVITRRQNIYWANEYPLCKGAVEWMTWIFVLQGLFILITGCFTEPKVGLLRHENKHVPIIFVA